MSLFRRARSLIQDPEHEKAEREARMEAKVDALLVELWGPLEPLPRIAQVKPNRRRRVPKNPVVGDWRVRVRGRPES